MYIHRSLYTRMNQNSLAYRPHISPLGHTPKHLIHSYSMQYPLKSVPYLYTNPCHRTFSYCHISYVFFL